MKYKLMRMTAPLGMKKRGRCWSRVPYLGPSSPLYQTRFSLNAFRCTRQIRVIPPQDENARVTKIGYRGGLSHCVNPELGTSWTLRECCSFIRISRLRYSRFLHSSVTVYTRVFHVFLVLLGGEWTNESLETDWM